METISNGLLCVEFSPVGAEVQSIKDAATGREYLWQADKAWWGRRAPILFPIVGHVWNNVCKFGDRKVELPMHGIMRDLTWTVTEHHDDSIRLEYEADAETLHIYPFHFRLAVTYRLDGRKLVSSFEVENTGDENLWFQFGGHPGFNLPEKLAEEADAKAKGEPYGKDVPAAPSPIPGGYIRLEGDIRRIRRAAEQGCFEPDLYPVPADADGTVTITDTIFDHDALIFDEEQITAATILDRSRRPIVRMESSAPVWLFWSESGGRAPFVCIEPWYGLCDAIGFEGDVSERAYIQCAKPGTTWNGYYTIEMF